MRIRISSSLVASPGERSGKLSSDSRRGYLVSENSSQDQVEAGLQASAPKLGKVTSVMVSRRQMREGECRPLAFYPDGKSQLQRSKDRSSSSFDREGNVDVERCLLRLHSLDRCLTWGNVNYVDASLSPEQSLISIKKYFASRRLNPGVIRAVAGLAAAAYHRSLVDLPRPYRIREPIEQDLAWMKMCVELLEDWYREGKLQIIWRGAPLRGSVIPALHLGVRPKVMGDRLLLSEPPKPLSPESSVYLSALRTELPLYSHRRETPELDRMTEDKKLACRVLGDIVSHLDLMGSGEDLELVRRLLDEGRRRPGLKDALHGLLPYLSRVASRAEAAGRLAWSYGEGVPKVALYRNLIALFPEVIDHRFVKEELLALASVAQVATAEAAARLLCEVGKSHPDLLSEVIGSILELPYERWSSAHFELISSALSDYGWKPTRGQVDRLVQPLLELSSGISLFGYGTDSERARKFLRLLAQIHLYHREVLDGIKLEGKSLADYLLDRILNDPASDVLERIYRKPEFPVWEMDYDSLGKNRTFKTDQFAVMDSIVELVFPEGGNGELGQRLLRKILSESQSEPQRSTEIAIGLAAALQWNEQDKKALAKWMTPILLGKYGRKNPALRRAGVVWKGVAMRAALEEGGLKGARKAMKIAYTVDSESFYSEDPQAKAVTEVQTHLGGLSKEEKEELLASLPSAWEGLSEQESIDLDILVGAAAKDPSLRVALLPLAKSVSSEAAYGVQARVKSMVEKGYLWDLRNPELPLISRLHMLSDRLGKDVDELEKGELIQAFRQGLLASSPSDDRKSLLREIGDEELLEVVSLLGDRPEGWRRLAELRRLVGDMKAALSASKVLERELRRGVAKDLAWQHALAACLVGGDSGELSEERDDQGKPAIIKRPDAVVIGKLKVPVRS